MKSHLLTAALAAAISAAVSFGVTRLNPKIVEKPTHVTVAASKHAWPDLTMDETIALGEGLSSLKGATVAVVCNDAACDDLAHDIDNAMEIANAKSTLERSVMPLGYGMAVVTGPGDRRGGVVADAIMRATAGRLSPAVQSSAPPGALYVVIGKRR